MFTYRYHLKSSQLLCYLLGFIYVGSIICSWYTAIPWWISSLLTILCIYIGYNTIYKYTFVNYPWAVNLLWQDLSGIWYLLNNQGKIHEAQLMGDSYLSSWLIIANFELLDNGKRISILITKDRLNKNEFRRLTVQLRMTK